MLCFLEEKSKMSIPIYGEDPQKNNQNKEAPKQEPIKFLGLQFKDQKQMMTQLFIYFLCAMFVYFLVFKSSLFS